MKRFPTFNEATNINTRDVEFIKFMNRDAHKEILEAIVSSNYYSQDNGYINFLLETVIENNFHHKVFEGTLTNEEMYPIILERYINEGKIKDWFDKKIETAKGWVEDKTEKAKEAGTKLIAKLKSFGDIVKIIKDSVAGFLKACWDYFKKAVTAHMGSFKDDLVKKWKHWNDNDEGSVTSEIKNFDAMSGATVTWALNGFPKEAAGAANEVGGEDSETQDKEEKPKDEKSDDKKHESYTYENVLEQSLYIAIAELIKEDSTIIDEAASFKNIVDNKDNPENASIIESLYTNVYETLNESGDAHGGFHHIEIPFIGKIVHKLAHLKPFVWLTEIEKNIGIATNNMFHKISVWINKFAAGPEPYKYHYLGQCAAFAIADKFKGSLKAMVHLIGEKSIGVAVAAMVPGLGWVLTMLKNIATGIWYIEVGQLALTAGASKAHTVSKNREEKKKSKENPEEKPKDENPEEKPKDEQ